MSTLRIVALDTPHLGNRSYLVHDGTVGIAVDIPRDVDRTVALAAREGVRLEWVVDTHGHGDWLTGGPALARLVGARYAGPAEIGGSGRAVTVVDGTELVAGTVTLRARHTPGHTPGHMSYVISDTTTGAIQGVLTGGSLLHGAVGRTDLLGADLTRELAHRQWSSVRSLAAALPPATPVLPMHGFGSFCSAGASSGDSSTLGAETTTNPALTQAEEDFVTELLAGLDAYPSWYAQMGPRNAAGPDLADLSPPATVDAAELRRRLAAGEWVVDLRTRQAFAQGHLAGTVGFDGAENVVTYLGWLLPPDAPLTLLGPTPELVAQVRRELTLIGVDQVSGQSLGGPADWAPGDALRTFRRARFADLPAAGDAVTVLDVRRRSEWEAGHLPQARHIPLHELPGRLAEVPDGTVWVHCAGGFRASIAAGLLDRTGRHEVVSIDDSFDHARELAVAGSSPA